MNNIRGIGSYSKMGAVGATSSNGAAKPARSAPVTPGKTDAVEISPIARFLAKIADMPDIRAEKVEEIRQGLANGSYDVEGRLPQALDKMLSEYSLE